MVQVLIIFIYKAIFLHTIGADIQAGALICQGCIADSSAQFKAWLTSYNFNDSK